MTGLNRALVALIGLGALAAGILGVATTYDWIGEGTIDSALPFARVWHWWRGIDWTTGAKWALVGVAAAVALLALALLLSELRLRVAVGRKRATVGDGPRGRTTVRLGRLERAVAHDAETVPGVERARVEQLDVDGLLTARLRVSAAEDAVVPALGAQVIERTADSLGRIFGRTDGRVTAVIEVDAGSVGRNHERRVE